MAYNKIDIIPTEDIRSEPKTYPQFIITSLNRLTFLAPILVEKDTAKSWRALETAVRFIDSNVVPYHTTDYQKNVTEIEDELVNMNIYDKNYYYIVLLQRWVKEITKLLPRMGALPPTVIEEYDLATKEQLEAEKRETAISFLKEILKEKGKKGIEELVAELQRPPQKKEKPKSMLTIADVIDKSYLSEEGLKKAGVLE